MGDRAGGIALNADNDRGGRKLIIATALATGQATDALKERVVKLAQSKPLYEGLESW